MWGTRRVRRLESGARRPAVTGSRKETFNADLHVRIGSKLPKNHGPWGAEGSLRSDQHPPHRFSRARIEEAIKLTGFQLWRLKQDE